MGQGYIMMAEYTKGARSQSAVSFSRQRFLGRIAVCSQAGTSYGRMNVLRHFIDVCELHHLLFDARPAHLSSVMSRVRVRAVLTSLTVFYCSELGPCTGDGIAGRVTLSMRQCNPA